MSSSADARFELFAFDHLAALALTALVAVAATAAARRFASTRAAPLVRCALALLLVVGVVAELVWTSRRHPLSVWDLLPLQLCDAAIFVALAALFALWRPACTLLYYWACSGTVLAMITPDVSYAFPHPRFFVYFGLHGAVVCAAVTLVYGYRIVPRAGAPWRAWVATNVYAGGVGIVDSVFSVNYLYLCRKPAMPTLLDAFGPWPIYIAVVEVVALVLFFALDLPLRAARRRIGRGG